MPAGQTSDGVVAILSPDQRADQDQFVHHFGQQRQVLADLDARDAGGNGFELAANLRGRVHPEIEDVLMRRAAWQENHDHSLVRTADTGLRFGLEKLWQGKAAKTECADPEKISARDSVAEPLFRAVDCQHKRSLNL